jgi:DNA-binding transcriptional MerR regulator
MYTVGQVSKATNVSVRTLHYYDHLDLLKPAVVGTTGYRYYDKDALMRLQQITALKKLGLPLARIKQIVTAPTHASAEARWKAALELQLDALRQEQARLHELERLLRVTLNALEMTGDVQPDDICMFIKALQPDNRRQRDAFLQRTFTPDEQAVLMSLPDLDADDPRTRIWVELLRELREHRHMPPDAPISQHLAARVVACAEDWFRGDAALIERWWELIRPAPGEAPKVYGLDADVMHYIEAIIDWYMAHGAGSAMHG